MVGFLAFMTLEGEIFNVVNEELHVQLPLLLMGAVGRFPTLHVVTSPFDV